MWVVPMAQAHAELANVRFWSKADMCSAQADVRFVPKADIGAARQNRPERKWGIISGGDERYRKERSSYLLRQSRGSEIGNEIL